MHALLDGIETLTTPTESVVKRGRVLGITSQSHILPS